MSYTTPITIPNMRSEKKLIIWWAVPFNWFPVSRSTAASECFSENGSHDVQSSAIEPLDDGEQVAKKEQTCTMCALNILHILAHWCYLYGMTACKSCSYAHDQTFAHCTFLDPIPPL